MNLTVAEALRQLPVSRLAHFTPARNLWHILAVNEIRSSKDLADNAPEFFSPTDQERFDGHPNKVCCTFQYPNGYYFADARRNAEYVNYPNWVCLLLDVQLLLRPGTLFSPCNSATGRGIYLQPGGQALLDCFAPVSKVGRWLRQPNHHPAAATDLQAEALVPGPIDLSYLHGIVVGSEAVASELYGALERGRMSPERFNWIIAPVFFDRGRLSQYLRYGRSIIETPWTPSTTPKEN
ncbi:DarT ssDNA thymidine ADP-ribosyltransferase family protein [Microbispora sp. H10836]|uniref:DarT ssDNA thymidine ADP-ribosyltransferase family protein n=1 Tax=Microbispora sp. H10836 TaxID=2729106 RepID=UPI0014739061|nr:DarT ssDNA thymidine ADP-ribosyltransferase family protein [Microbispora sp. H10836]